jgi:hypothetical protein
MIEDDWLPCPVIVNNPRTNTHLPFFFLGNQGKEFAADCLESIPMTPVGWWIARQLRKPELIAAPARAGVGLRLVSVFVDGESVRSVIARRKPHSSARKE